MFSLSSIIKKIFVIPSFLLLLIPVNKPKAFASPVISNANDVSFTVSWISTTPATCEVRYGPTTSLDKTAYDVRGANHSGNIHYVEISDLLPESIYYFDVVIGTNIDNNGGMHYSFVTGPTSGASLISDTAYGQVVLPDGSTAAQKALVYVSIRDNDGQGSSGRSTTLSSLVESGYWNVQLTNARLSDMGAHFNYSLSGDILEISVYASDGSAKNMDVDTSNDTPAPQVQINDTCTEEVCDYVDNDCDGLVDEADAQGCTIFFRDMDGDGHGVTGDCLCLCAQEAEYRATQGGDPDDLDPKITCTVDMEISEGWSMISLPLTPNNSRLSVLFSEAIVVYCYKRDIGYERVKPEEEINVGIGYWILLDQQQSCSLNGQVLNNYTLVVENGWYMIGGCTSPAQPSVNTGNISVIYSYVIGSGYQRIQDTENLEPGNGYWILVRDIVDKAELKVEGNEP